MELWIDEFDSIEKAAAELAPAIRVFAKKEDCFPLVSFSNSTSGNDFPVISAEGTSSLSEFVNRLKEKKDLLSNISGIKLDGIGSFSFTFPVCRIKRPRLDGKTAVITGGAQGFGEGIARELAAVGAHVVIVDLNESLAQTVADSINNQYDADAATAFPVDVGNEESVQQLMHTIALKLGGFDILISNAGVLRAGGLEEMTLDNFEFVTKINYTAFFLITK